MKHISSVNCSLKVVSPVKDAEATVWKEEQTLISIVSRFSLLFPVAKQYVKGSSLPRSALKSEPHFFRAEVFLSIG